MAELLINKNDIENLIKSYKNVNSTFTFISSFVSGENITFRFYIDCKECTLIAYFKKGGCNVVATGKNIDECNKLINYLCDKCVRADVKPRDIILNCDKSISYELINYIKNEQLAIVERIRLDEEKFRITGYGGDYLTISIYNSTLYIQGKPLCVFGIILSFLDRYIDISSVVKHNPKIEETYETHKKIIMEDLKDRLGEAYCLLDKTHVDSMLSSYRTLQLFKYSIFKCDDYSGVLTGSFKALEGYIKKVLIKLGYSIENIKSFSMFYKDRNTKKSQIDVDDRLSEIEKKTLYELYNIYSNKRNVYLHGSGIDGDTQLITNYLDALSIFNQIVDKIKTSYEVFSNKLGRCTRCINSLD